MSCVFSATALAGKRSCLSLGLGKRTTSDIKFTVRHWICESGWESPTPSPSLSDVIRVERNMNQTGKELFILPRIFIATRNLGVRKTVCFEGRRGLTCRGQFIDVFSARRLVLVCC